MFRNTPLFGINQRSVEKRLLTAMGFRWVVLISRIQKAALAVADFFTTYCLVLTRTVESLILLVSRSSSSSASSTSKVPSMTRSRDAYPATLDSTPSSYLPTESTRSGRFQSSSTGAWLCGQSLRSSSNSSLCRTSRRLSLRTSGPLSSTKGTSAF